MGAEGGRTKKGITWTTRKGVWGEGDEGFRQRNLDNISRMLVTTFLKCILEPSNTDKPLGRRPYHHRGEKTTSACLEYIMESLEEVFSGHWEGRTAPNASITAIEFHFNPNLIATPSHAVHFRTRNSDKPSLCVACKCHNRHATFGEAS